MASVILVIHLILALAIIALVMIQRSEGGGLGIGGGGGGMGSLANAGQTANVLTRATALCATAFFITSLTLAILGSGGNKSASLLENLDNPAAIVDKQAPTSDKDVPKALDKPEPQSGAPSAPISE